MGTLAHFHLPALIERYGIKHFVETGTGTGESLAMAVRAPFKTLTSIELVPALARSAKSRFEAENRVTVIEGASAAELPAILAGLPADEPVLFWLDAHFAGADYGLASYDAESDMSIRLPLETELGLIASLRGKAFAFDMVLIDDARVYQAGPYGAGDLPADFPGIRGVDRSLDFVRRIFGPTHGVVVDYAEQGYVMCCPRMTYDRVNA